jgi:hypothetical protein
MKRKPAPPTVTVTIAANCAAPRLTEATEGGYVRFCNNTQCTVSVTFPMDSPFAYDPIFIEAGECVSVRVLSDSADALAYGYSVKGACCGERPMSTPQIKIAPPPPSP